MMTVGQIFAGFVVAYLIIIALTSLLKDPMIFAIGVPALFIIFVVLAIIEVKRLTRRR